MARLIADTRGGAAVVFAIAVPVLAVITAGAIDLNSVNSDHVAMQDVADATALEAAKQFGIGADSAIISRAKAFADAQLTGVASRVGYTVVTAINDNTHQVTVTIDGSRQSFFGNLLPPGGWHLHSQAIAVALGGSPLCVLSSGTDSASPISLDNASIATANGCLVQADSDMAVRGSSTLTAGLVQTSGSASGSITPSPQVGAPAIADPFANMNVSTPGGLCLPINLVNNLNLLPIAPGLHCGNLVVQQGMTMHLAPGVHYFTNGTLQMKQNSTLQGTNVVLVFDDNASFQFDDSSVIDLSGRQSGSFAGFVIATTRKNQQTFEISSDAARTLLGTIYIPNATLHVTGSGNRVADQSAWTVVVAKSIQLTGSPNLVINSNYAASNVPAPSGVGPNAGSKVKLVQ